MTKKVRCILNLNGSLAPKIFASLSPEEIKKFKSAGLNGEEIASYQKRGERLHKKILLLEGISYREGSIALENELFHLGQTTYKVLKDTLEGKYNELPPLAKIDILERFFIGHGDSLSQELFNFIRMKGKKNVKEILEQTSIPEQLLLRTMPKEEYSAYMCGKLPIIEGLLTLRPSNLELIFQEEEIPSSGDDDVPF